MINKNILSALLMLMSLDATAQTSLPDMGNYKYADATQLWRNTENVAGLTIDSAQNRGLTEMNMNHLSGSYHRIQEGNQTNDLNFFTERYQHIGKYLYGYGKFNYNMGRTKERAFSDVIRTYNSNPFISGSSVLGKYDFQNFDLTAKVGTIAFNGWRFGLGLNYKVGDLSRLRDPRSRSQLLDYQLIPSVNYTSGLHTIGLSGWYHRYKEKIPGITTVQNDPNLYYYQMMGMEAYSGTVGGYKGFSREYVDHNFGAELSYGFRGTSFSSVNAVSVQRSSEHIYEIYKREPGKYINYGFALNSQNRFSSDNILHQIDIHADYQQSYADEYRPKLVITTDSVNGYSSYNYVNTFTYKKRYQQQILNLNLRYRANFTEGKSIRHYIGIDGKLETIHQKHLLPESTFKLQTEDLNLEMGTALLKNDRLWIEAETGYHFASKAELNLGDDTGTYAQSVLLPDMLYYQSDYWRGKLQVVYQFPLTIKKVRSLWYVKGYAQTIQAQNSLHANQFGLAIGVFN
jgi:hypothetical protein